MKLVSEGESDDSEDDLSVAQFLAARSGGKATKDSVPK